MGLSLHAAFVPSADQMLGTASALLDKAEAHCTAGGHAPATLIEARLADDMLPFAYQVKSVAAHSLGAIEGVRRGEFNPDRTPPPSDFAGLRERIAAARSGLAGIDPDELEAFADRDVTFVAGDFRVPFVGRDFLLSFSQPNLYFHATTAYAILRSRGVDIGKRDFLGAVRRKPA